MKKLRLFFKRIPRKVKIAGNILLCLLMALWIYLLTGSPAGATAHYRRAERANLVGPGEILAVLDAPELGYENLVLAEDGDAVMLFVRDEEDSRRTQLVYRERSQGLSILSAPPGGRNQETFRQIPIFLFDGYDDARKAELTLFLPDGTESSPVLYAAREADGYFLFRLDGKTKNLQELIRRLLLLSENTMADTREFTLLAQVRLLDAADSLLADTILTLE